LNYIGLDGTIDVSSVLVSAMANDIIKLHGMTLFTGFPLFYFRGSANFLDVEVSYIKASRRSIQNHIF
jgi:hypothetical protein